MAGMGGEARQLVGELRAHGVVRPVMSGANENKQICAMLA